MVKGAESNGVLMLQAPIANYARKIIMIQMIVGTNAKSAKGTYTTKKIVFTDKKKKQIF